MKATFVEATGVLPVVNFDFDPPEDELMDLRLDSGDSISFSDGTVFLANRPLIARTPPAGRISIAVPREPIGRAWLR